MATNITERNKQNTELLGVGYTYADLKEWPPKTRLYRHTPSCNIAGEVTDEVGTYTDNVPGDPAYVLKKARLGLFTRMPGPECKCKWCVESFKKLAEKPDMATEACNTCDYVGEAKTTFALAPKMKSHKRKVHGIQ